MPKIYRPEKPPEKTQAKILRLVSKIKDTQEKLNKSTNKLTEKIPQDSRKDAKKKELEEEYQKELEWREREVAKVFREGRNRGGRPTKLNESVMRDAEILARIGLSEKAIAQSLMISEPTLTNWMKKNKEFFGRIKRAREKGKSVLLNSIYGHGQKNWTALAWLLERQYFSEYGVRQKMELTGKEGGPVSFRVVYEDKKESTAATLEGK